VKQCTGRLCSGHIILLCWCDVGVTYLYVALFCCPPGDVPVKKKKPSKPVDVCGYPTHQLASLTPQTLSRHIFPSAYPWTLAFHKSLQLTGVWPEWRPNVANWTLVDDV